VAEIKHTLWSNAAELERELRQRNPCVRLVTDRQLLRVLASQKARGANRTWNTRLPVWANRAELLGLEMPSSVMVGTEPRLLLLTTPDDRLMHNLGDDAIRAVYGQLLDRTDVVISFEECDKQLAEVPPAVRRELRFVLESDRIIPPAASEAEVYQAAWPIARELQTNRPDAFADYFPLWSAGGAGDHQPPQPSPAKNGHQPAGRPLSSRGVRGAAQQVGGNESLGEPSAKSSAIPDVRNHTRTAIAYYRRPEDRDTAASILRDGLVHSLAPVLHWDAARLAAWQEVLPSLLPHTTEGSWPAAAKALYELQKLALDLAKPLYAVTPIEYLRSFGSSPIRQSLDKARDVILLQHFTKVRKQLRRVALHDADRHTFDELIRAEVAAAEHRINAQFRPVLRAAFDEAGLLPTNPVETIAREKLISELLDLVSHRGFFRFADVRDAIARNQLKLPDFANGRAFVVGDSLLKVDKILARDLFGIYQRGEIYLRGIQRMSGAAFGTSIGRGITLFLLLPFVGAFLSLEFVQHVVHGILGLANVLGLHASESHGPHFVSWWAVLLLGGFFLGLIHWPPFRERVWRVFCQVGSSLHTLCVKVPTAVVSSRVVQFAALNPVSQFVWRNFAFPLIVGVLASGVSLLYSLEPWQSLVVGVASLLVAIVVIHSPPGRRLYELVLESILDAGRFLWASLIPGLISWLVWFFREVAAFIERLLYTVDEWLRFREGQSKESLVMKSALALVWFPIAYVVRFVFYLLVEPQVNPVKHFPVVTVSHKVIWPMVPQLAAWTGISAWTWSMIVNGIPGIFGFIAWELKENWRLYSANRPERLTPVSIGHHGETIRGLLRPGFHSGTIPKLYRKLRNLWESGRSQADKLHHLHEELHHCEHAIRSMVEREFLPLFPNEAILVNAVRLGCQRVEVSIGHQDHAEPLLIAWELRDGAIIAETVAEGWSRQFSTVGKALHGLNALAAVNSIEPPRWEEWSKDWPGGATGTSKAAQAGSDLR
jgi:hypothetical protein